MPIAAVAAFQAALRGTPAAAVGGDGAAIFGTLPAQPTVGALPAGLAGDVDLFMHAVGLKESGGRYHILGPQTRYGRPRGKYQILDSNWAAWAAEAGMPGADWRDPQAQEHVARHKMLSYFRRFGSWEAVAVAWFAGPGRAAQYLADPSSVAGLADVLGTSVARYVRDVTAGMGRTPAGVKVGGGQVWTADLVGQVGQQIADAFGMRVSSHRRSASRNAAVGGARRSDHLWGGAIDLSGTPEQMRAVAEWASAYTGPGGPFRIVLHPGNDRSHDDHVHISWHRNTTAPLTLPGQGQVWADSLAPGVSAGIVVPDSHDAARSGVDAFRAALSGGGSLRVL